jgi:hypothetical protein
MLAETLRSGAVVACVALASGGCTGDSDREVLPPVVLGMPDTIGPSYDDGEQKIYQVSSEVPLPYRRPDDGERPKGSVDPYPNAPFHVTSQSRVTIRFTLSNLDDKPHNVDLLLDPWNEFVHYVPGFVQARENEVLPNFSGIQRTFIVGPKDRIEGIITPDDMLELAIDLTTAMALQLRPPPAMSPFAGPALYNRAFNIQNRSTEPDLVLAPWIPSGKSPIAAVTGFDLGLRTAESAKLAVELVVDIADLDGNRVVMDGDPPSAKPLNRPGTALSPPAGAPPM